jgi:phospholipid/cholesterol/gamma-HCH transport system ATP-binding protein
VSARSKRQAQVVLAARGIVNRFGQQRVHDQLELEVRAGEVLGIAGGSGSGKSVLLKTLTGLHRPAAGQVLVEGAPIEALEPVRKAALFGVLFQQGALFSSLSVAQNVLLPLREHTDLPPHEREKLAALKLELAGLSPEAGAKFPAQLSGGMVKRAALARALALDPRMLFLDEPTSGLDPATAAGIDELILALNRGLGLTVVIVTHDLNTLFTVCDRVALLVDGQLETGTVDRLSRSREPWIREFLHGPRAQGARSARQSSHGIG